MSTRSTTVLFEAPSARIAEVACRAPASGCGREEWSGRAHVVLPRRGVFIVHRGAEHVVADANTALVFGADDHYRVSHPAAGGDVCTVLLVAPELVEEALGSQEARHGSVRVPTQIASRVLSAVVRTGAVDDFEAEDAMLRLFAALAADLVRAEPVGRRKIHPLQRQRVEEVRALLASSPAARWRLDALARAVHCSPFHLAREFRAVTGESVSAYLLRLRLGVALHYLGEGESRLTALALRLGFAHHSHFSARFRRTFGTTPTAMRRTLTQARLRDLQSALESESWKRARS